MHRDLLCLLNDEETGNTRIVPNPGASVRGR
jgi:hypothetical protein